MPLLFAVTLFVSASLLFMVQPMVGKMILPLLGGSPAVWNACMVFFQALLLLGYLYAHHVSTRYDPKTQWKVHMVVLAVPVAVMAVAVAISTKHTPIAVAESLAPSGDASPFLAAMALLTIAIGIPFFVSSTSAPLLQKWFAYTGHPAARDPYFLYAASNAGSLISLLGYPLLIEPSMLVAWQTWLWGIGFVGLVVLIFLCGKAAANPIGVPPLAMNLAGVKTAGGYAQRTAAAGGSSTNLASSKSATATADPPSVATPFPNGKPVIAPVEPPPSRLRMLKWVVLAFVPSSWMLAVTFHMTTDMVSLPLLWVLPLALYLVTFIIAFSTLLPSWFRLVIGNLAPVMILLLVFCMLTGLPSFETASGEQDSGKTMFWQVAMQLGTFFAAALMCHYELARDRPKDVSHLTTYFLLMSVGGVLGGLFNALIAPLIFPLAYEYYVTIAIACLMVPRFDQPDAAGEKDYGPPSELELYKRKIARVLDFSLPALTGLIFWLLSDVVARRQFFLESAEWLNKRLEVKEQTVSYILLYMPPVMACFFFVDRPLRFALAVSIILGIHLYRDRDPGIIHTERTFFGILKIEPDRRQPYFTKLIHGTTLHGTQFNDKYQLHPADLTQALGALSIWDSLAVQGALVGWDPKQEPLTYYHRTGPVGAMFYELRTRKNGADRTAPFAMVGLGTGSVSCYALPGQSLTFYEIDAVVKRLVADQATYFTYVTDAKNRGATVDVRLGDARLKLKDDVDKKYALLLVDAFSSDAIPVHLCTKEAVELYVNRLTDDGILALHISNKYVRLEPVVARIAKELNLVSRIWSDGSERYPGKTASSWVVLARDEKALGILAASPIDQVLAFGTKNLPLIRMLQKYGPDADAKDVMTKEYGADFGATAGANADTKEAGLAIEDFAKKHGSQAATLAQNVRRAELAKHKLTLRDLTTDYIYRDMFKPLKLIPEVHLWTDDYTDVLQVMMLKPVQWMRKKLDLPTPGIDE